MAYTWTQLSPASSDPGDRDNYGLAYDKTLGLLVLCIGFPFTGVGFVPGSWTFDSSTVDWSTDGTKPNWGRETYCAYDPANANVVQFGGHRGSGVMTDQTWLRDSGGWAQASPANSPSARSNGLLAYCPALDQPVLYGGWEGGTGWPTDTLAWTGTNWVDLTPATDPGEADEIRGCTFADGVLAFGRFDPSGGATDETWFFDGTDWAQLSPATSPPVRQAHAMGYDETTGKALVFGGMDAAGTTRYNDLWSYDGTDWFEEIPDGAAGNPSARTSMSLAWDQNLGCMFMYGGSPSGGVEDDETWKLCSPPSSFISIRHMFGLGG